MITDAEIRVKGLKVLTEAMGTIEAEKFVSLIMRERFDYTEWQKDLWPHKTVEEISEAAMKYRKTPRRRRETGKCRTIASSGSRRRAR